MADPAAKVPHLQGESMLSLLLMMSLGQANECARTTKSSELVTKLDAAETAYADLDEERFRDLVNELAGLTLPCVTDAIPAATSARYHRLMGLHLSGIGDDQGAERAVTAAKIADPDYTWTDALLLPDHPLRVFYEAAEPSSKTRKAPEPRSGSLSFDGESTRKRPKFRPAVVQLFDEQGRAQSTNYLGSRESLPPYRAIPRQRTTLIIGSGSALILSGVMYGLAHAQRGNLFSAARDPETSAETLDAKRARVNGLTFASGALFGIAVGTGVGAAVIGER